MDIHPTFFDWVSLPLGFVLMIASFVSKSIVWGRMVGGKPQKITWFGRIFLFLVGLVFVYQSGLTILKSKHVLVNPTWFGIGLAVSKFFLEILFLVLALPFLIASIRALIRREEPNKINRLITVALAIVWAYLLWNVLPGMAKEVSTVFHR
jgi:hypothetical protein